MKRITSILCICICFLVCLSACGANNAPKADGAYVAIKDDSGTITGYERKYHNDNGDITRWDVYTADEIYDHYVLYEYDSNGRLGKETRYRADGIGEYYYAYSYTEDGTLAEKDYVTASEGSTRILYDDDGTEKERYSYDWDDTLIKYEVFDNGTWKESELPVNATETDE